MVSAVGKYRRKLSKNLKCCGKAKRMLITAFDQKLDAYLEENPIPSEEALLDAFGAPAEMAAILMEQVSSKDVKMYRIHTIVTRTVIGLLILLFIAFTAYIYIIKSIPVYVEQDGKTVETVYNTIED